MDCAVPIFIMTHAIIINLMTQLQEPNIKQCDWYIRLLCTDLYAGELHLKIFALSAIFFQII